MKPENVKCPKCNGDMVSRKGPSGPFWGCRSYPQCNGTRDSNGDSYQDRQDKRKKFESKFDEDKEDLGPDNYWDKRYR